MADFSPIDPSQRAAGQLPPPTVPPPAPSGFPAWQAPGAVPPGYVQYGSAPIAVQPPTKLRTAAIALLWAQVAASAAFGFMAYRRGSVVDDFLDGSASFSDLDSIDTQVAVFALLALAVGLAWSVLLCLWSFRTVKNAQLRDRSSNVSPGMAAGGWFIPIGSFWLPWQQLRRATAHFRGRTGGIALWQGLTIASGALTGVGRFIAVGELRLDSDGLVSRLYAQGVTLLISAVFSIGVAIVGMKAMRDIDSATSGSGQAAAR